MPSRLHAVFFAILAALLTACAASHHATTPSELGRAASSDAMLASLQEPGPIRFERVVSADWVVDRSGLINLEHPTAVAAGLEAGPEPIQVYFYALTHPTRGTFLVDSGVESGFLGEGRNPRVSFLVKSALNTETLDVHTTTAAWLERHRAAGGSLDGVFLAHLHLDHSMGLPDLPDTTPVYVGADETRDARFLNFFSRGTIDRMLEHVGPLREWRFAPDAAGRFEGVLDVFGDGSLFALHVPGHTRGSTAFLARTLEGPKLLTGDACHTAWGWVHGVEPGSFSTDGPRSVGSLAALRALAAEHPEIEVHLGHQSLDGTP
jgi:glyoxylase-like metal-dependent hydrolase (beta-lactamase superfamily II)